MFELTGNRKRESSPIWFALMLQAFDVTGQQIQFTEMSHWAEVLKCEGHIVVEDVHKLKDNVSFERQQLLNRGVSSLIAVALVRNNLLIGVLCVEQVRRAMNHIEHLAVLGDYVAVLINRRDLLTKIENDNVNMQRLMNDTPGGFVRMKMLPEGGAVPVFVNDGFCRMMGMSHDEVMELYANMRMPVYIPRIAPDCVKRS